MNYKILPLLLTLICRRTNEALKYYLKNLINTQEMLNRQVAFLLFADKFYMPEYSQSANTYSSNVLGSTLTPFLSSTLFGQINNALSQLVEIFLWDLIIGTRVPTL